MKRKNISTALAMLLAAGSLAYAQEQQQPQRPARQNPEVFTGVVINGDNSVTFRYKNPKAVKVEVSGEFMEGSAQLVEKDGIWTYTTAPLASEMYFYTLSVDGSPIVDMNYSMTKDIPRWMNYFIISGEKGDIYSVQDVPHGTVSSRWYESKMLQMRRRVNVYTPAGYENSKKKYPVFYLLHGNACDENSWLDLGRAAQILDNLIAQGKAEPMIVVMTNGNPAQQAAPAYFGDTYTNANTMPGIAAFPDTFSEVIAFVESNYRTISKKEGRAIAGFSMGGGHAFTISKEMPNTFDYVGLFSAAGSNISRDEEKAKLLTMKKNGYKLYYIGCGTDDFLYRNVLAYNKQLDDIGFKYYYRETSGGHTWGPWRIFLSEMVPMLFK
ncbi:MAG: alpha/beta hydrolase-fold protein [Rikenellaceae bacterium]|nr:alpha/beta hydrolase-fold protein [Rikenellaceae bacterium]